MALKNFIQIQKFELWNLNSKSKNEILRNFLNENNDFLWEKKDFLTKQKAAYWGDKR